MVKFSFYSSEVVGLLLLGLVVGCGGSTDRHRVYGTVSLDGEPVPKGSIAFVPAEGADGPTSGGNIEDGEYDIYAAKGPAVGSYRVEIHWPREAGQVELYPGEMGEGFEEAIPAKYNSQSTLEVQIEEGTNNHDFALTAGGA